LTTIYPKKRFGQNFLIDPNILRKIVEVIDPQPGESLIEIGPGRGALTALLLERQSIVHAIEIDHKLVDYLKTTFVDRPNLYLYEADVLDFDLATLLNPNVPQKIVGNLPYNIISPLLFKLFEFSDCISQMVFLVQKEIALRLCAKPSSKDYGILSVMARFYTSPRIEFHVSPRVFRPVPKVFSSVITLVPEKNDCSPMMRSAFRKVVRTAFNQRRKTLKNALHELLPTTLLNCPIDLQRRAETLSVAEFISLTDWLQTNSSL